MGNTSTQDAHVTILMATYNGSAHLQEQLDSIAAQSHSDWSLLVGDDGSTDTTQQILLDFQKQMHSVEIVQNGGLGSAANFMSLLKHVSGISTGSDWVAFTDQDDVWLDDKLERGLAALKEHDTALPALYCSRTLVADSSLSTRVPSAPRPRAPSFRNALVQNIASGNTILLNPAASKLVCDAALEAGQVVMHDWWVYMIVTGAGGVVIHDNIPTLLYRQHEGNVIGDNTGTKARLRRIAMIISGEFRRWNDVNTVALKRSEHRMTPSNRNLLNAFAIARKARLPSRLVKFRHLKLYRQTALSTWALWFAVLLGRV